MEHTSADAQPASSTGTEGANTASSPAAEPNAKPDTPLHQRMQSRMDELRGKEPNADRKARDPKPQKGQDQANPSAKEKAGDVDSPDDEADDKKAKDDTGDADLIPRAAFNKRVGKLTEQRNELREQVAAKDLEVAKATKLIEMLSGELERYREAASAGKPIDERDEKLRHHELVEEGRKSLEQLTAEHRAALEKQIRAEVEEERRAELRETLSADIEKALRAHPRVQRSDLISVMRLPSNVDRSAIELAALLDSVAHPPAATTRERPPHPRTAKAKANGNAAVRHPANLDGLNARLAELRAQNT